MSHVSRSSKLGANGAFLPCRRRTEERPSSVANVDVATASNVAGLYSRARAVRSHSRSRHDVRKNAVAVVLTLELNARVADRAVRTDTGS